MRAYYNENDPCCAQWLRNLIAAGHIAPGEVDERSIVDVRADDLGGFTQCHFFAGIGVWSHALRLAGWPDDRPVWTGSCPCQPFSAAGKGEGTDDARHLWPEWFRLVREHRPVAIFGEQVAAAIRHSWLDLVCADLEGLDYAVGTAVMGAHSVGAPHIRQRLYFVADAQGRDGRLPVFAGQSRQASAESERCGEARGMADSDGRNTSAERLQRSGEHGLEQEDGGVGGMADPDSSRAGRRPEGIPRRQSELGRRSELGEAATSRWSRECREGQKRTTEPSAISERLEHAESDRRIERRTEPSGRGAESRRRSFWSDADWLPCIDGKARPTQSGIFPLVNGYPNRVGILRAAGNAIVPQAAAEFVKAYMETSAAQSAEAASSGGSHWAEERERHERGGACGLGRETGG